MNSFSKGSEWRRWDLHIHTPNTKLSNAFTGNDEQEIWDGYIDELEKSSVQVFGITDYFSCNNYFSLNEKYKAKYPKTTKVFFLNIEFRLSEAISQNNNNPHFHIIFDNDQEICSQDKIVKFLDALKTLDETDAGVKISCAELQADQFASASVSIEGIKNALSETFGESKPYLLCFPAKNDGVKSTDSKSPRKVLISDKIDKFSDLFFGDSASKSYFLSSDRYAIGKSKPKPVVSGSDAHSFDDLERLEGNTAGFEPTWIKADLTFRGLKQIVYEPETRVFIGIEPPVEQRKAEQATKFISNLKINQVDGYDGAVGQWFKDVDIPINSELTAIIGNKGSGKSALVDIIGLLGESKQEKYFSFLSDLSQNKKFKKKGYAENFEAELEWESSASVTKGLDENVDFAKPEAVRYLPQSYFEQLTNEIEIEAFRHEVEEVVFSHVDQTERMEMTTFSELQEFKTEQSLRETSALKANLRELNIEIIRLENEADPIFKKSVEEQLKTKRGELEALKKQKPDEVSKPDGETEEQTKISEKIALLAERMKKLENAGKNVTEVITEKKNKQQKLISLRQSISTISTYITAQKQELAPVCEELGLDIESIFNSEIKLSSIEKLSLTVKSETQKLEKNNELQFNDEMDFDSLESLPDVRGAYSYIKQQITELKEQLGTPQRKYQGYLDKLAKWNSQLLELNGEEESPKLDTIRYLEAHLSYIDNELSDKISEAQAKRAEISKKIFISKEQILTFYSELKKSVETKLADVRTDDFSVDIQAAFVLEQTFSDAFLRLINKSKRGSFHGNNNPQQVLRGLLSEINWDDFESILGFVEKVLEKLKTYEGEDNLIKNQVNDTKEFYDFLFSFGYFSPRYELRLGGKNLNELSPGEKGLLLLVFYLQLDKDNIPLVIDQPEDNLDNESIFTVLANCIREAKKQRQVILVTHNPNLAVGADAEQIVYVQLEKANDYKFNYESGSIENSNINRKIVNVLEGTQPAFVKRRLKYQIK